MRVSVVIPVLNGVATIRDCLESVLSQSVLAEIVIIDGGSRDGTLELLESYRKQIAYFESGLDRGVVDAFNRGVRRSSGDVITILNSDDYWEPGILTKIVECFYRHPEAGVVHGWCRFLPITGNSYIKKPDLSAMKRYMSIYHPTMFVKRTVYERIGLYNEHYSLAMDSEWVHRAMQAAVVFQELPAVVANMRMGGLSDTNFYCALNEYRRSAVMNELAGSAYAGLYFFLHLAVKFGSKMPILGKLKMMYDRRFNKTVDIS